MKILTTSDFETIPLGRHFYWSYKFDKYEICLEYCLNGFDVAIYIDENLIEKKICLNMENYHPANAIDLAIKKANELCQKYGN